MGERVKQARELLRSGDSVLDEIDAAIVQSGAMRLQLSQQRCAEAVERLMASAVWKYVCDELYEPECECRQTTPEREDVSWPVRAVRDLYRAVDGGWVYDTRKLTAYGYPSRTRNNREVLEWQMEMGVSMSVREMEVLDDCRKGMGVSEDHWR